MYLFLVPSVSCTAKCKYCNGPKNQIEPMSPDLAVQSMLWVQDINNKYSLNSACRVTFHGGEPLLAGTEFYTKLFKKWHTKSAGEIIFGIQSNLWLLTDHFCDIFANNHVSIGTSLDGPPEINDFWRGSNYYVKTLQGIQVAKKWQLPVSSIATITKTSSTAVEQIFNHFIALGMNFNANAAQPRLIPAAGDKDFILLPEEYNQFLKKLLYIYLNNLPALRIDNIDRACRAILTGQAHTCIYKDCLGDYFAVDPYGYIYPCMRFVGLQHFSMGRIRDNPDLKMLRQSPVWMQISERNRQVQIECSDCSYWNICMGGCPYNWLTHRLKTGSWKDPYCAAYKGLYEEITKLAFNQICTEENFQVLLSDRRVVGRGLLQNGSVLNLMSEKRHPNERTMAYRRIVAAFLLGTNRTHNDIEELLVKTGISESKNSACLSLNHLKSRLTSPDHRNNDVYLHITNFCELNCTHCYANSSSKSYQFMSPDSVSQLINEIVKLRYRRIVLTGGEPLSHPKFLKITDEIIKLLPILDNCYIVLRSNLVTPVTPSLVECLDSAIDQIVVSIDGGRDYHDAKRFKGAYDITLHNLETLLSISKKIVIRLGALVDSSEEGQRNAQAVAELGNRLGISSIVVRNPRPIGRAIRWVDWEHQKFITITPETAIYKSLYPRSSCGRGANLHIESDGYVFPCYADLNVAQHFGKWPEQSLEEILSADTFKKILAMTIDDSINCCKCWWRYLCGGICLAWAHASQERNFNMDQMCQERKQYAQSLLDHALKQLRISAEEISAFAR